MVFRKAKKEDSESIAGLLMLATGEVMYKFIGEKDYLKAISFLHFFVKQKDNQYSFQNCFVAEVKGEIVGAILGYDGAKLLKLRKPVLEYVNQTYSIIQVEEETQEGEYYIDSFGVLPSQQGKGIGSKLLQYVIIEKANEGIGKIGLLVDKTNSKAKKLYLNLGFVPVGEKELVGLKLEHLQLNFAAYDF